ncbi:helix-turn-helix domain-containing protein (plasmid) [Streptomyces sp. NBC_00868]|uniref:helix-turn-helix domain-containing protein n=1 Tax=Streptomyces sp. NBC_00868 TaxID=2903683 RepID=UPI002F913432|nr:helix-turn-helix domain-containing protein [Streptomyces sp. NBC_00868]
MNLRLPKNTHLLGPERARFAAELKKAYISGTSIRELSEQTGRSFGWVHRMLGEAGVVFRSRGGPTRATGPEDQA